jgi:hypothetical protein
MGSVSHHAQLDIIQLITLVMLVIHHASLVVQHPQIVQHAILPPLNHNTITVLVLLPAPLVIHPSLISVKFALPLAQPALSFKRIVHHAF